MSAPSVQHIGDVNLLVDPNTNAVVGLQSQKTTGKGLVVVVGTGAPSNGDGYPDDTIYIQKP